MNAADIPRDQLVQPTLDLKPKNLDTQTFHLISTQPAKDEETICQIPNQRYQHNLDVEHCYQVNPMMIQEPEEKARRLSWREAFSLCHTIYANPRTRFHHDCNQASEKTKPTGRRHPRHLRHWTHFHHLHKVAFKEVCDKLDQPKARAFESQDYYRTDAQLLIDHCTRLDGAELVYYEEAKVESLVLDAWTRMGNAVIDFKMPSDHPLDNINNRRSQLRKDSDATIRPMTKMAPANNPYDRVCCITTPDRAASRDLFVIQYKSATMLAPNVVENGLHDMDLERIMQEINSTTDESRSGEEIAEWAMAAALAQSFDFMVDKGLSYGYVKEGKTFIFLFIRSDNPSILFYETVILESALIASPNPEGSLRLTAVGLISAFIQMSLDSQPWSKGMRRQALEELPIWQVDESRMLETPTLTPTQTQARLTNEFQNSALFSNEPDNKIFIPYSPTATWVKAKFRKDQPVCQDGKGTALEKPKNSVFIPYAPTANWVKAKFGQDQDDCQKGSGSALEKPNNSNFTPYSPTVTCVEAKARQEPYQYSSCAKDDSVMSQNGNSSAGHGEIAQARPDRPYCTQACLLGLIRGHVLDKKCPNVDAHQKKAREYGRNDRYMSRRLRNKRHALDQPALAQLIEEQLQKGDREDTGAIQSLDRSGWAGALFRVELVSHGYTFVGKGTVEALIPALHTEAKMYERLDAIQGKAIPVYLGRIDLKAAAAAFHLTSRVAIVHLILLSWAGEEAWRQGGIKAERLWLETARTNAEVAALGVQQADLRRQNVLWNTELDRAILIDFEFAHIDDAQDVIEAAIAEEAAVKEELKLFIQKSMRMKTN